MELNGEKLEALHIEYSFRRLYGIDEDGELIRRYHMGTKGLLLYQQDYMVKGSKDE